MCAVECYLTVKSNQALIHVRAAVAKVHGRSSPRLTTCSPYRCSRRTRPGAAWQHGEQAGAGRVSPVIQTLTSAPAGLLYPSATSCGLYCWCPEVGGLWLVTLWNLEKHKRSVHDMLPAKGTLKTGGVEPASHGRSHSV